MTQPTLSRLHPSSTITVNMLGETERVGTVRRWENAKVNKQKQRTIDRERVIAKERRCGSLMSPLTHSTMKWRCLVFMFYHRSRPPEQTHGSSQTWGWIRLDSNQRWTGSGAVSVGKPRGLRKQTITMTFHFMSFSGVKSVRNPRPMF